ncbi:MAG TPA: DUF1418 family protein [Acidiferrobacterales bacterium]|jgi:hypothetical protein
MSTKTTPKIPPQLLILDAVGVILAGLGLAERLAGTNLVPTALRFENYDIVMIVVGILLMVPLVRHIVNAARAGR